MADPKAEALFNDLVERSDDALVKSTMCDNKQWGGRQARATYEQTAAIYRVGAAILMQLVKLTRVTKG